MRYFEDFAAGEVYELGSRELREEEILAFAREFDPQPFHTDPEAARDSAFGGLIASGWHTGAVFMRLFVENLLRDSASMGSPGIEELRWLAPVRPGDVLHARTHIEDTQPSSRREDRGTVFFRSEVANQDGVLVMRMRSRGHFGRRPA